MSFFDDHEIIGILVRPKAPEVGTVWGNLQLLAFFVIGFFGGGITGGYILEHCVLWATWTKIVVIILAGIVTGTIGALLLAPILILFAIFFAWVLVSPESFDKLPKPAVHVSKPAVTGKYIKSVPDSTKEIHE